MTARSLALRELFARAVSGRRRVFGFSSRRASCAEVRKGKVEDGWDRFCVEGDATWTVVAVDEENEGSEAA
jgi:hypothetical protein